jgi:uncharacterized protein (TIGR01777 family)
MTMLQFKKTSRIEAPAAEVFWWHSRAGALERLTPPWESIQILEKSGGIESGGRVVVKMKAGPFPMVWEAKHTEYMETEMFQDVQVRGPFSHWTHTHRFIPNGDTASILEDIVDYQPPMGVAGRLAAGRLIRNRLEQMFSYRHAITKQDLKDHQSKAHLGMKHVLISGASGVVGRTLAPFLSTGGHHITKLVRHTADPKKNEVFWNPITGKLDPDDLRGTDTIIHLAGENIGTTRWTDIKKQRIIDSRVKGTRLIAETAAKLDPKPEVLICASAIGYYGNRGECVLNESDAPGDDYISWVCSEWEQAAAPAIEAGIRVVFARIGIALTPAGGALEKLILPFKLGFGGKIASGSQYMSWISIDDVIGALYHLMASPDIEGPVNLVAPHSVTNMEFTRVLARIFSRPAIFTVPAFVIKMMFGEMGNEIPLSSTRVTPSRLVESGYTFRHPLLEDALAHVLGKNGMIAQ